MCSQHIDIDRAALLLIDLQQELFRKRIPIYRADALLDNVVLLSDRARRAGHPVVYVQHSNQGALKTASDGWQLHPRLTPRPDDLSIHKQHDSAFHDTPLKEMQGKPLKAA